MPTEPFIKSSGRGAGEIQMAYAMKSENRIIWNTKWKSNIRDSNNPLHGTPQNELLLNKMSQLLKLRTPCLTKFDKSRGATITITLIVSPLKHSQV